MESVPLDMDDIFGGGNEEEETDNYPGPLADLPEELEPSQNVDGISTQDAENSEVLSKLKDLKGASKRTVKPVPKLDGKRLTGERGIPTLPNIYKDVKFKGKGHEMQDLKTIMDKLEHWCHRLYPRLPFDDVLLKIERLGNKKEVQTCIKKMRMDMPILASDFVGNNDEDGENAEKQTAANDEAVTTANGDVTSADNPTGVDLDVEEAFDKMMRQEASQRPSTSQSQSALPPKSQTVLSDEQKERMERNKRIAQEKRLARLGYKPNDISSSQQPSTSSNQPNTAIIGLNSPQKSQVSIKQTETKLQNSEDIQIQKETIEDLEITENMSNISSHNTRSQTENNDKAQPLLADDSNLKNTGTISISSSLNDGTYESLSINQSKDNENKDANLIQLKSGNDQVQNIEQISQSDSKIIEFQTNKPICPSKGDLVYAEDINLNRDIIPTDDQDCTANNKGNFDPIMERDISAIQNRDITMETDEQQTAEEILEALDNL